MRKGVLFFYDNYAVDSKLANSEASSEQPQYPLSNAFNFNRRSKVWRSNGYFLITSSNNAFVFRETIGVDLTATVAVGEYNSTPDFLAAIKTALEAVGTSTYTVTQTTDKKISIQSDGFSGNVFQIRGADVNCTLASVLGYNASNIYVGSLTYVADLIRINTSEWVLWDAGLAILPNAFAMTASKLTGLKLSPSSTVILKGNSTNPLDWSSPEFSQVLDFDGETMALIADGDSFYTQGLRYWRLEFMDIDNAYGYIEVGAFFLGRYWTPDDGCAQFPLAQTSNDRTVTSESESGQSFSDIKPITDGWNVKFEFLSDDDKEDLDYWFKYYGTGLPFFVSLDSNANFSSTFNKGVKYCKLKVEVPLTLTSPHKWSTQFQLNEEL